MKIFLTLGSAMLFGLWPIVMRLSGLNKNWASMFIGFGVLSATIVSFLFSPSNNITYFTNALGLGLIAGLMNGIGMLAFNQLLSSSEIFQYITMNYALLPAVSFLGGIIFLSEPLTIKKIFGLLAAILAAVLLA